MNDFDSWTQRELTERQEAARRRQRLRLVVRRVALHLLPMGLRLDRRTRRALAHVLDRF